MAFACGALAVSLAAQSPALGLGSSLCCEIPKAPNTLNILNPQPLNSRQLGSLKPNRKQTRIVIRILGEVAMVQRRDTAAKSEQPFIGPLPPMPHDSIDDADYKWMEMLGFGFRAWCWLDGSWALLALSFA